MAKLARKPTVKRDERGAWVVTVAWEHFAPIQMHFHTWRVAYATALAFARNGRNG